MTHLIDDPPPYGLFSPEEAAIIRYAQASTAMRPITDELYAELSRHFDTMRIMELWATVSLSNQVNRFHATFLTDVDDTIMAALGSSPPLPIPPRPIGDGPECSGSAGEAEEGRSPEGGCQPGLA